MSGHPNRWQLLFKRSLQSPDSEKRKANIMPYRHVPPMPPAVEAHRARPEYPLERSSSRGPSDRPSSRPTDRPLGHPLDRSLDRSFDRSLDRSLDPSLDRSFDHPLDRPSSRRSDRPSSRQTTLVPSPALSSADRFSSQTSLALSQKPSLLANDSSGFRDFKYEATISNTTVTHRINGHTEVWVQEKRLGGGTYGDVYLQKTKDARNGYSVRAVKAITRSAHNGDKKAIKRELNALITLRKHKENFVDFYGWYEAMDGSGTVFIAMEYIAAGDLSKYMEEDPALAKENCKRIVKQILDALEIMHQNDFCHRDLKPQNILVASTSPLKLKLADFGIAKSTNQEASLMKTAIGTTKYIAPEVLGLVRPSKPKEPYNKAVDMWALGTLAHEIMTGSIPFCTPETLDDGDNDNQEDDDDDDDDTFSGTYGTSPNRGGTADSAANFTDIRELINYCDGKKSFPLLYTNGKLVYSSVFKDFIQCVLLADPAGRLTAAQALQHPWINEEVALVVPWYESRRPRGEVARARLLGLKGVIRATKVFREMVPRPTVADEEDEEDVLENHCSYGVTEQRGETRLSGEQYPGAEYGEAEFEAGHPQAELAQADKDESAEAERVRNLEERKETAKVNILGLRGMLKAIKRFRQAVPRPADAEDPSFQHPRGEDVYVRHSLDRREDSRHTLNHRDRDGARHSQDRREDSRQQAQDWRATPRRAQVKHIPEVGGAYLAGELAARSNLAKSRLLGIRGVLKACKRFRQLSVSHQTDTGHESRDSDPYTRDPYIREDFDHHVSPLDTSHPVVDPQYARVEHERHDRAQPEAEAEAERVRLEKKAKAKANLLGITGMFKAIKQFRRNVPKPATAATAAAPVFGRGAEETTDPFNINYNIPRFTYPQYA